jgi:hypothetical protein
LTAILVGTPLFLQIRRVHRVEGELAQTKAVANDWQHKYEKQLQQTPGKTESPTDTGNDKLPILASVFTLNRVRSVDPGNSEPPNRVVTSRQPQWIVLSLDREETYKQYRVTLTASSGRVLWNKHLLHQWPRMHCLSVCLQSCFYPMTIC